MLSRKEKFVAWLYIVSAIAMTVGVGQLLMRHFGVLLTVLVETVLGGAAGFLLGWLLARRIRGRR